MNRHTSILLSLLLFAASSCFAYDVVLKNGKILTGEVVSENEKLIILRDTSGVELRIKKTNIDSIKTQERNAREEKRVGSDVKPPEKLKRKSRVYKKEDLEKMPELTVLGSKENPEDSASINGSEEEAQHEKELEAAWNEAALQIDDEIRQAQETYDSNKSFCDKVIPDVEDLTEDGYVRLTAEQYEEQRRIACMEAEAAAKDLEKARAEYDEFLEDARKKGIPPGWVDPERIRD